MRLQTPIGKSYEMAMPSWYKDPAVFFTKAKPMVEKALRTELKDLTGLKFSLGFEVAFVKFGTYSETSVYTNPPSRFYTKQHVALNLGGTDVNSELADILIRIEEFVQNGSGWRIHGLTTMWLDIFEYRPIRRIFVHSPS